MICGIRHQNGRKNIVNIEDAASIEEVIACIKAEMPTAKTILVDMSNPKFIQPESKEPEAA